MRTLRVSGIAALASLLGACTTGIGTEASGGAPGPSGGTSVGGSTASGGSAGVGGAVGGAGGSIGGAGGTTAEPIDCTQPPVPDAPLRRLTRFEYNNTVRDWLGVETRPADALPGEEAGNGFGNDANNLGVSRLLVDGYRGIAEQMARELTVDDATVIATAGCDPAALGDDVCSQQFINSFLLEAFRRPVTPEDVTAYTAMFAKGVEIGGDFATGVRAVIARALQSPQYLYRVELGETVDAARGLARPTGYEMASRLSYLLWGSSPTTDDVLMAAAADGTLNTAEGVRTHAERMLLDERARDVTTYFHGLLFGIRGLDFLERNAEVYPTYRAGMGGLFRQETERFIDDVIWQGAGDLASLFTAPYTYVNNTLADFYGIANVTNENFEKVQLEGTNRAGILTQASVLAATTPGSRTDPVVRGKWVFTRLLCGEVGDPPANVPEAPEPEPGVSVRERLAQHRDLVACRGCHSLMDPIGFGLEHFDGVGLWRDEADGVAVDDSGEIVGTDVAGPFNGALELSQKIAQSVDARNCFVGNWLTYAYGRAEEAEDQCTRASLQDAFAASGGNIKSLLVALTQTDAFLYRPVVTPGL